MHAWSDLGSNKKIIVSIILDSIKYYCIDWISIIASDSEFSLICSIANFRFSGISKGPSDTRQFFMDTTVIFLGEQYHQLT